MDDTKKTLKYLEEVEELGQTIISDKNEIIELNKRHNVNREAMRALQKNKRPKHFISIGSLLIKTETQSCLDVIQEDQRKIEAQINILRSNLKIKVNQLRDLEFETLVPGIMLKPLNREEMNAVTQVMGGHST